MALRAVHGLALTLAETKRLGMGDIEDLLLMRQCACLAKSNLWEPVGVVLNYQPVLLKLPPPVLDRVLGQSHESRMTDGYVGQHSETFEAKALDFFRRRQISR